MYKTHVCVFPKQINTSIGFVIRTLARNDVRSLNCIFPVLVEEQCWYHIVIYIVTPFRG